MSFRLIRTLVVVPVMVVAACGSNQPVDDAELAARAARVGSAPEMVRVPDLDGFEPVPMSVGAYGENGFAAAFVNHDNAIVMVMAEPARMTNDTCPQVPVYWADESSPVECAVEDDGWYRRSGDQHEYAARLDGIDVRVSAAMAVVDSEELRLAAVGSHAPTANELDALIPSHVSEDETRPGTGDSPVERGDLPPYGGAPINPDGTGREG